MMDWFRRSSAWVDHDDWDFSNYQATAVVINLGTNDVGATPVLITPVSRRDYDSNGQFRVSFPDYVNKVHDLVAETGVAMIDLSARSRAYLNSIGPEAAKGVFLHLSAGQYPAFPDGVADNTHFQEYGADQIARIVSDGAATLPLPIADHVR